MGYVDKATMALLGSDLLVNFISKDGSKVADITHADTNEHTLTPAGMGVPDNVIAILCAFIRASGTGDFGLHTKTAGNRMIYFTNNNGLWPLDNAGVFRYSLGTAGDDWDIRLFGYLVQGRLEG